MIKKILLTCSVLIFALSSSSSIDPFNYYVEVKNFRNRIYSEKTSYFRLASSDAGFSLISSNYQKILKQSIQKGNKIIEIETGMIRDVPPATNDPSEFLSDTRFLNLSSPEITKTAESLKMSADTVTSVEEFVYGHITEKSTGMPLVPAAQVCRMKRGDCTEHSVLAVALLRKLGVPARAVVGMILVKSFRGRENIFVYHMWVEAFSGGKWTIVDATRPGERQANRYIAFAYHNLKTESPLPYLRAISAIQDLTVQYLGN
jgi:transglutaminase-like putative cysteine protease